MTAVALGHDDLTHHHRVQYHDDDEWYERVDSGVDYGPHVVDQRLEPDRRAALCAAVFRQCQHTGYVVRCCGGSGGVNAGSPREVGVDGELNGQDSEDDAR